MYIAEDNENDKNDNRNNQKRKEIITRPIRPTMRPLTDGIIA